MGFSARRLRFGENADSLAAHALLKFNSTTSCPRSPCAVAQGAELGPGDLRLDVAAEAAVGAVDDISRPRSSANAMMRYAEKCS